MIKDNHPICALATPNGIGAIAMIRVSGTGSLALVERCFSKKLSAQPSHTVHFGAFRHLDHSVIDEVLISVFADGKSFTGEESVEISCHASPYIQQQILQALLASGFRLAEPGEFTLRAFANGKMDLSQAEAVADLIASQSKVAHEIALKQLRGGFSSELRDLRERLIHFASMIELELYFAEEDVEFADRTQFHDLLNRHAYSLFRYIRQLSKPALSHLLGSTSFVQINNDIRFFCIKIGRRIIESQMPIFPYSNKGHINGMGLDQTRKSFTFLFWVFFPINQMVAFEVRNLTEKSLD